MEIVGNQYERILSPSRNDPERVETLYNLEFLFTWINVDDPKDREEIRWFASGINGNEKGVGSAMTYSLRYFMLDQFQIPTGKDDPDYLSNKRENSSNKKSTPPAKGIEPVLKAAEKDRFNAAEKARIKKNERLAALFENYVMGATKNPKWIDWILENNKTPEKQLALAKIYAFELAKNDMEKLPAILKEHSLFKGKDGEEKYISTPAELEKLKGKPWMKTIYGKLKEAVFEMLEEIDAKKTEKISLGESQMELKTVNASLQKGLKKIETAVSPEVIQKLESFKSLTIAGINDKAGYEMVNRARITAKNQRIALDKMRKEMGEEALRYKQAVDSTAKRIQDTIIAPAEEHLKAEIERINAEKARIELAAKIEKEIAACWEEAHTANEQFDDQKAETERLEKQRIEQAEKEAELAAKQAEIERKEREARIAAESRAAAEREAKAKIERAEPGSGKGKTESGRSQTTRKRECGT